MHDSVTQTLYSASLLADTLPVMWEKNRTLAEANLTQLGRLLRSGLAELRTLLLELRPAAVRDQTLSQLVGSLVEAARARMLATVSIETKGDFFYPEDITIAVFRIAQESLNNAINYADASELRVVLVCRPKALDLCIVDNGNGFDPAHIPTGHLGIGIMKERAAKIGAAFHLESRPGRGTEIHVAWPAEEKSNVDG